MLRNHLVEPIINKMYYCLWFERNYFSTFSVDSLSHHYKITVLCAIVMSKFGLLYQTNSPEAGKVCSAEKIQKI